MTINTTLKNQIVNIPHHSVLLKIQIYHIQILIQIQIYPIHIQIAKITQIAKMINRNPIDQDQISLRDQYLRP